ncbi:MAG: metallophosphoesterase [Pseudonocardia sp.]|nr:metallophosphoesterase [Pseudonocardia sp.]
MRVHVVSDVHGNTEALARAADGADGLIVLGDLLEFVDYHRPEGGIIGRLLGAEVSAAFGRFRATGDRAGMLGLLERSWARFDDPRAVVEEAVGEHYDDVFGVLEKLDVPVWAIPGNVDMPELWPDLRDACQAVDGTVVTIGGVRVGFAGGVPLPPGISPRRHGPWQPYFLTSERFDADLAALGPCDVLCTHAPPQIPDLAYDVVARRSEASSPALRERIRVEQPTHALFGHVHQPLAARSRLGRTECVNVGHFRRTERPYVLRW